MTLTIHNKTIQANLIKSAHLSTGYTVRLWCCDPKSHIMKYIVTVTDPQGEISHKSFLPSEAKSLPFAYYLDCICCHA